MTSSGIEVREEEKGFFKKLAAYRGRNYICAKHAQVFLCCGVGVRGPELIRSVCRGDSL